VPVADEPIVGLDPESALTTRRIFTSFAQQGGDLAALRAAAGLPDGSLESPYLHFTRRG
jgi:hypothetical protein